MENSKLQLATLLIHPKGRRQYDESSGAVIPAISLSTTFAQHEPGKPIGEFEYSRSNNPCRRDFEEAVAVLEGAKHGFAFSSGSAATATILYSLDRSCGCHIICVNDVYGGTNRFMNQVTGKESGVRVEMLEMDSPQQVIDRLRAETRIIWIESPTNPTLRITDIRAVSSAVKATRPDIWVVVDNTFMTPINQKPLSLGADIVVHSVTKYLNGHSDVLMGAVLTNNPEIAQKIKFMQNAIGAVPSPFDCWLASRGMKTLALRMGAHELNARKVAEFLEAHPKTCRVIYPGLSSHPQHSLASSQQSGFGGMVSFTLASGSLQDAIILTKSTRIFTLAESLGGIESLIEVPAIMTHASVPMEQRIKLGISDSFIRLSCGIEDYGDLIQDLSNALAKLIE